MRNEDVFGVNVVYFIGVVEDINDPLKAGRVRVRMFNWHTQDKKVLPTSKLPWATPMQPTTSAATNGVGQSATGLLVNSWVVGIMLDGIDGQRPLVLGSIGGIQDEPDINRLARGDGDYPSPLIDKRNSARTTGVSTAGGGSWSEPEAANNTEYPHNHVFTTEGGHVKEYDDTDGSQRIHEYHNSGTYYEIDNEGNKVTRIVGDKYTIVAGTDYVNVKGSCNLTIDSDCSTNIKGNWNLQVGKNINMVVGGNVIESVGGNITESIGGSQTTTATSVVSITAARINLN